MAKPIRTLLADDTLIAREGWRAILANSSGIVIVGEAIVISQVLTQTILLQPDVILLDLRWGKDRDAGLRMIRMIKEACLATRVVAISAYDDLFPKACFLGADAILTKDFSRSELLATIIGVCEKASIQPPIFEIERNCQEFLERLDALKPGRKDAKKYETLMEELLPFLLGDHLSKFESQCRRLGGAEILDLMAFINPTGAPLWSDLRDYHSSNQIVFEMKNTQPPEDTEVEQLAGYLGDQCIHAGVMITRKLPTPGAILKALSVYQRHKDVILFLKDDDVQEMIYIKRRGDDPTELLLDVYLNFIRHPGQTTPRL